MKRPSLIDKHKFRTALLLFVLGFILTNCVNRDHFFHSSSNEVDSNDFFDFKTNKHKEVTLRLGVSGETIFYLYSENPTLAEEDASMLNPDIHPFYAAVTDAEGNYSNSITMPASVTKIWLVAEHVHLPTTIELDASLETITYPFTTEAATRGESRALMGEVKYPDGFNTLGAWDKEGVPNYLLAEPITIPTAFLKRCNDIHSSISGNNHNGDKSEQSFWQLNPQFHTAGTNDMVITKNTSLVASYFKGTSGWENMIAYYTYQEGETMDINTLATTPKTILFPRYSTKAPTTLLAEQVQLMYWNKEKAAYQKEFPAGTRIGWILLGMGFGNTSATLRYSNPAFNRSNVQYSILMQDPQLDNCFFMAMEDNIDFRYNDAMFAILSTEDKAIEELPVIPDPVGKDEISYRIMGTLAFEDSWPSMYDYDMNDVVINFTSTLSKKIAAPHRVTRTTTTFTPVNNGAYFTNGFGIQLDHVASNQVESLTVSQNGEIVSSSFEAGTQKPVVILYENNKAVLNQPIIVDILYRGYGTAVEEAKVQPPYNPFIFAEERSCEVHLTGYEPTSKLDESLRGTKDDLKEDKYGNPMYYVAKDNMPFALYLNGVIFDYPGEKIDIRTKYSRFENWVKSFGTEDIDWYK